MASPSWVSPSCAPVLKPAANGNQAVERSPSRLRNEPWWWGAATTIRPCCVTAKNQYPPHDASSNCPSAHSARVRPVVARAARRRGRSPRALDSAVSRDAWLRESTRREQSRDRLVFARAVVLHYLGRRSGEPPNPSRVMPHAGGLRQAFASLVRATSSTLSRCGVHDQRRASRTRVAGTRQPPSSRWCGDTIPSAASGAIGRARKYPSLTR
jgi:hypothetical protein